MLQVQAIIILPNSQHLLDALTSADVDATWVYFAKAGDTHLNGDLSDLHTILCVDGNRVWFICSLVDLAPA